MGVVVVVVVVEVVVVEVVQEGAGVKGTVVVALLHDSSVIFTDRGQVVMRPGMES